MATSTILEPIKVNDERGAEIIIKALENAEKTNIRKESYDSNVLTTDPDVIRRVAAKAMEGAKHS